MQLIVVLPAQSGDKPVNLDEKFSYALGVQIGNQILQQNKSDNIPVQSDFLLEGLKDALTNKELILSIQEMNNALIGMQIELEKKKAIQLENIAKNREQFLENYMKNNGVMKTESGILYKKIVEADGVTPNAEDSVTVHYIGKLTDGTEFDSSHRRGEPTTFGVKNVILGWQEILQLMPEGSTWEVIIPPELAYGSAGAGNLIGPEETLVFEIQLIKVNR